jgi:5-methylcytosine-specific restriction endonuclease McrA
MNPVVGKTTKKKMESHQLTVLARDLLRCSDGKQDPGFSLYGAVIRKACEIVGKGYSGSPKAFLKEHREVLRKWCQDNWKPKKAVTGKQKYRPSTTINVKTDSFLQTYEWRRVRMEALKKYGPRCQCCGATPATGAIMNVDHIKPRKLFPQLALDVDNLQILCHECNHGKGNWDMTDWRATENSSDVDFQQKPPC